MPLVQRVIHRDTDNKELLVSPDDTFTFNEMRIILTAFALWTWGPLTQMSAVQAAQMVDQFVAETVES